MHTSQVSRKTLVSTVISSFIAKQLLPLALWWDNYRSHTSSLKPLCTGSSLAVSNDFHKILLRLLDFVNSFQGYDIFCNLPRGSPKPETVTPILHDRHCPKIAILTFVISRAWMGYIYITAISGSVLLRTDGLPLNGWPI